MATTTNYGWTTPDDTALVKDGASAIRTLGSSVDTTTKALNPSTTLGDIEYRSSTSNTNTRLGIGSTGNVLTVSGGVPTWAAPAGSLANYALIGSAALTAASTITISGISSKNSLFIYVAAGSCTSSGQNITIQFNTDSGANYYYGGITTDNSSTGRFGQAGASSVNFIDMGNTAADVFSGYMIVEGTGSAGIKPYTYGSFAGGSNAGTKVGTGYYSGTSAVSSVSVLAGANFDAGTIYVYGA
jgi:hypothetical protein